MSTLNQQSVFPNGQSAFSPRARGSGSHEVPQHLPTAAAQSKGTNQPLKLSWPSSSRTSAIIVTSEDPVHVEPLSEPKGSPIVLKAHSRGINTIRSPFQMVDKEDHSSDQPLAMVANLPNHYTDIQPLTSNFLSSLLDSGGFNPLKSRVQVENGPLQQQNAYLAVVISSAVKLESKQLDLITRKMQRLTGFAALKLENVIDPSLIAGFVISYDRDGSKVIDLSVKGQLAALAARIESADQRHRP